MNYGYIRVSTDKQTVENQRFEIMSFCERENIVIDRWIEETISGTMEPERRKLGRVLVRLKKDDVLYLCGIVAVGEESVDDYGYSESVSEAGGAGVDGEG